MASLDPSPASIKGMVHFVGKSGLIYAVFRWRSKLTNHPDDFETADINASKHTRLFVNLFSS